jgi:chromate reductase, NAD(P)H dehydrogenase (quinone)
MAYVPRILAFAGSLRKDSFNKKLVRIAAKGAQSAGAAVTVVDLNDFPLPLFNEDIEKATGLPEPGRKLREIFVAHDGLLIASPEYNSSITGVLKNTLDWLSRPVPNEPAATVFANKVCAIMSASPGGLGGLRAQPVLRSFLQELRVLVLPDQFAVAKAHEAFDPDGTLKDAKQQSGAEQMGAAVAELLKKLNSGK